MCKIKSKDVLTMDENIKLEGIHYAPVRKKANRFAFNVSDTLEQLREEQENDYNTKVGTHEMQRDISIDTQRSLLSESSKMKTKNKLTYNKEEITKYVLSEAFCSVVYESIPEEFLQSCECTKKSIYDKAREIFISFSEERLLEEGNGLWKDYYSYFIEAIDPLTRKSDDDFDMMCIMKELTESTSHTCTMMGKIVSDKIKQVMLTEKYISSNKEQLMTENRRFNGNTLFSNLVYKNYNLIEENKEYIGMEKDEKLTKAFNEAVSDYAILECLNTFNLFSFNHDNIKNLTSVLAR
jgi:hypothetical protein